MKKWLSLVIALSFNFYACEQELPRRSVEIPSPVFIDLNDDGRDDFTTQYRRFVWDGNNAAGFGWRAELAPIDTTSAILDSISAVYGSLHTFSPGDEITVLATDGLRFVNRGGVSLLDISTDNEGVYPDHWRRVYQQSESELFLGLSITEGGRSRVGYLKISTDIVTGRIEVLEKAIGEERVLVE